MLSKVLKKHIKNGAPLAKIDKAYELLENKRDDGIKIMVKC